MPPRKRMLDPALWSDPDFSILSIKARLLFIAMISHADDEGRGEAHPGKLRRDAFGYDDITLDEIEKLVAEINNQMRSVQVYQIEGRRYYQLLKWREYQYIQKPRPSTLPALNDVLETELTVAQEAEVESVDEAAGAMFRAWEGVYATISPTHAQELELMAADWDAGSGKLPDGDKRRIAGYVAVTDAVKEAVKSTSRPNLKYVKAILDRWMAEGYKSSKDRTTPKDVQETLTPEDLENAKKRDDQEAG